jgi:hypothetical protein
MRKVKHFKEKITVSPEEQLEDFVNSNFISKYRIISVSYAFDNDNKPHILLVYEDD